MKVWVESEQDSVALFAVSFVVAIEHVIVVATSFFTTVKTMVSATIGFCALVTSAFIVRLRTVQAAGAGRNIN
jgi:hypothetical protein